MKPTLAQIRDECTNYFARITQKQWDKMDDFERMVSVPLERDTFRLNAPEYVRVLLKRIDRLERK